jgi:hypothetical protein
MDFLINGGGEYVAALRHCLPPPLLAPTTTRLFTFTILYWSEIQGYINTLLGLEL